ncbi:MAG: hypothetical protein RMY34_21480 [Aulosira sp. DedQUE10]|nr:hypothetical protein [Aulosira sp. DedQUE10]
MLLASRHRRVLQIISTSFSGLDFWLSVLVLFFVSVVKLAIASLKAFLR